MKTPLCNLSEERREEIEELLTAHFMNEGCDDPDSLHKAFVGIGKRIPELSQEIDVPEAELSEFGWWLVGELNKAAREQNQEE